MTVEEQLISALAEVERLRKAVVGKDAEISHKDALLSLKDAEISQKNAEIKKLSDTLLWLRRKVFGKMSEKNLPLDPDQLLLFEQEHLTDEERVRLDKEVEAAEQQMTKTITVKVKPSVGTWIPLAFLRKSSTSILMGQPMKMASSRMSMSRLAPTSRPAWSTLRQKHTSKRPSSIRSCSSPTVTTRLLRTGESSAPVSLWLR